MHPRVSNEHGWGRYDVIPGRALPILNSATDGGRCVPNRTPRLFRLYISIREAAQNGFTATEKNAAGEIEPAHDYPPLL
jgi:hypothetical protein